jgi:two-component system OmpR family sensor kinase
VLVHRPDSAGGFAIAQRADFRQELALTSAVRTTLPLVFLLPVLLLLISVRVRQTMRPLATLAQELQQRSAQDLQPLPPNALPAELRPFVQATNALLQRVDNAMQNQQRFVADAAHELRTPLTALGLQAEALAQNDLPAAAQPRLAALQAGLARQGALVAQLLDLARVQAGGGAKSGTATSPAAVSLRGLLQHIVQDCLPLAQAKGIDLGVEATPAAALDSTLALPEHELYILLKNLVDNALRYTPAGGQVDIRVQAGDNQGLRLAVADNGPGIAPEHRQRVLQPFYRLATQAEPGSGLGLAIVAGIAQRWALPLQLDWNDAQQAPGRQGLLVQLQLPAIFASKI